MAAIIVVNAASTLTNSARRVQTRSSAPGWPSAAPGAGAALVAVLPQVVLSGVHPCLEVEEKDGHGTPQVQDGCCALPVRSPDIVWGREVLGGHVLYYAMGSAAVHEGMVHFLVCLCSSNLCMIASLREIFVSVA